MILTPAPPKGKELRLITYGGRTRRKKKRAGLRLLLYILTLFLAFVTLVAATSLVGADRLMKEASEPIPAYATNLLPPFQSVSFSSGSGQLTLKGWLVMPETEKSRGVVILVHQQGANRLPFGLDTAPLIRQLSRQGFHTLAFDLRHSGESEGEMASFGYAEKEDVLAALDWTARRFPKSSVVLYGFGSGTSAIFRALEDLHRDSQKKEDEEAALEAVDRLDRVAAVLVDTPARDSDAFIRAAVRGEGRSPFFWLPELTPYAIRLSVGKSDRQDAFAAFTSLALPVMIFSHEKDSLLQESDYRPLIAERLRLHPERTGLYQAEGQGHLTAMRENPQAYLEALAEFLDRWLPAY